MRLGAELSARLDRELSQLTHQTRAERELWHQARTAGAVRRETVRELAAELRRLPSAVPTPTEAELLAKVCGRGWRHD